MRRIMSIMLAAILFLDVVCLGVLFFTRETRPEKKGAADEIFERASILAVGNNLISEQILSQAAARSNTGGYDFSFLYENVADEIEEADLSVVTNESVISSEHAVTGTYPLYNAPPELADAFVKAGFGMVNLATNHALDYGEQGLVNTIDYLRQEKNLGVIGAVTDKEYAKAPVIRRVNGIRLAFVAFTDPDRDRALPENSRAFLMISDYEDMIYEAVTSAKQQADFVIVFPHWGNEYGSEVTQAQRTLAKKLGDWGADVVIGTNPHELQEIEYIQNTDGSETLVAYSLGNFVSSQEKGELLLGGMLKFEVVKNTQSGDISLENVSLSGVVTHYGINTSKVRLYKLSEYTDDLAQVHGVDRKRTPDFSVKYLKKLLGERISSAFLR